MARKRNRTGDYRRQVDELLMSTWDLEPGPAEVAVMEEAVRIADAHNDVDLGFEARQELIEAATFSGSPDVTMVAFAWCLARCDEAPDRFDMHDLLWKYKWVLLAAAEFPTIGHGQITSMLADMERRYKASGAGMHALHQIAREVYRLMGDLTAAKAAHAKVLKLRQDSLSDCRACEQHAQVKFYLDTGRTAQALKKAEPLVSGRMGCTEVPHATYSHLLLPVLFAGDAETAAEYHRRGVRLIRTNSNFIAEAARHLVFLTVTDNVTAAARYLERHLGNGTTTTSPAGRFEFARAAAFLFDRLAERPKPPRVRVPAGLVVRAGGDGTEPVALRDHFAAEAGKFAAAFDARNGNDRFTRRLSELADLKKRVTPHKV